MENKNLPYRHKGDLMTGPIGGHLTRLTVPMIWGLLAVISIQVVDIYFISMLGTDKLAAISFTFPVTMLISHLIFGVNIALSSVVSRMIGRQNIQEARRVIQHGVLLAFCVSGVVAIACYVFHDPLFRLLGADGQTLSVIREYMPLWLLGSTLMAVTVNGNSALRASGDTVTPAMIMSFMAVINIALNPVLIFGLLGAPAMGVKGAAAATLFAEIITMFIGLYFLILRKKLMSVESLHLDALGDSMRRLAVIAIPAGITNIITPAASAFIVALLAAYGPEAVAAYGVATRIEAFALLLIIALALGMAPLVGQNWGAEKFQRVHQTIRLSIRVNFVWSFLVALVLGLFARPIAAAFSSDPTVIYFSVLFFRIVPFSYAFSNLVFGWGSAFNAMGMPKRAFFMVIVKSLILAVPAVYIGGLLYGVHGIFWAIALVNLGAGIAFHVVSWQACRRHERPQAQMPAVNPL
jgi:putative MATE family efflux protein